MSSDILPVTRKTGKQAVSKEGVDLNIEHFVDGQVKNGKAVNVTRR